MRKVGMLRNLKEYSLAVPKKEKNVLIQSTLKIEQTNKFDCE